MKDEMKSDVEGFRKMISMSSRKKVFIGVEISEYHDHGNIIEKGCKGHIVAFILNESKQKMYLVSQKMNRIKEGEEFPVKCYITLEAAINAVKSTGFHGIIQMRV